MIAVGIAASCKGSEQAACTVDTDCPTGFICRDQVCGQITRDASAQPDSNTPPACGNENASCLVNEDCCSRMCGEGNLCAATTAPPPTPTCRGQLELCQNDCCPGLSCVSGSCR